MPWILSKVFHYRGHLKGKHFTKIKHLFQNFKSSFHRFNRLYLSLLNDKNNQILKPIDYIYGKYLNILLSKVTDITILPCSGLHGYQEDVVSFFLLSATFLCKILFKIMLLMLLSQQLQYFS